MAYLFVEDSYTSCAAIIVEFLLKFIDNKSTIKKLGENGVKMKKIDVKTKKMINYWGKKLSYLWKKFGAKPLQIIALFFLCFFTSNVSIR